MKFDDFSSSPTPSERMAARGMMAKNPDVFDMSSSDCRDCKLLAFYALDIALDLVRWPDEDGKQTILASGRIFLERFQRDCEGAQRDDDGKWRECGSTQASTPAG
jgi:hypothetical protein